ncbi:hypothetical protein E2C01_055641 [Portunus trituberculatus]|uniref:Uncharacterized protein n=1 Tax=Portunus trituberculatus TaxID=210409 RepID=A0A5B7GWH4_PORTR|nr:hypothetical protein [Portunus trituberculatus]
MQPVTWVNNNHSSAPQPPTVQYINHTCNTHSLESYSLREKSEETIQTDSQQTPSQSRTAHDASLTSHTTFSRHSDSFHHHWSRQHSLGPFWHNATHWNRAHSHCNVRNHHKTSKAVALASAITAWVSKWRVEDLRGAGTRALQGRLYTALPGHSPLTHLTFRSSITSRTNLGHFLAINSMESSKTRYPLRAFPPVFLELWLTQLLTQGTHAHLTVAGMALYLNVDEL